MANTPVDRLDFDQIKKSLKDYLRGQEVFKDYDFEERLDTRRTRRTACRRFSALPI